MPPCATLQALQAMQDQLADQTQEPGQEQEEAAEEGHPGGGKKATKAVGGDQKKLLGGVIAAGAAGAAGQEEVQEDPYDLRMDAAEHDQEQRTFKPRGARDQQPGR